MVPGLTRQRRTRAAHGAGAAWVGAFPERSAADEARTEELGRPPQPGVLAVLQAVPDLPPGQLRRAGRLAGDTPHKARARVAGLPADALRDGLHVPRVV